MPSHMFFPIFAAGSMSLVQVSLKSSKCHLLLLQVFVISWNISSVAKIHQWCCLFASGPVAELTLGMELALWMIGLTDPLLELPQVDCGLLLKLQAFGCPLPLSWPPWFSNSCNFSFLPAATHWSKREPTASSIDDHPFSLLCKKNSKESLPKLGFNSEKTGRNLINKMLSHSAFCFLYLIASFPWQAWLF